MTLGRGVQPGEAVQQGGLARAGRTHDRGEAGDGELEGNASQRLNAGVALPVDLAQALGAGGDRRDRARHAGDPSSWQHRRALSRALVGAAGIEPATSRV